MGPAFSIVATVAGLGLQAAGIQQQRKATRLSRKQQTVAARRDRRQQIRRFQQERGRLMALGGATGTLGSSGVQGGSSSLSAQLGESLGFGTQMSGLSRRINLATDRANTFGNLSGLAFGLSEINWPDRNGSPTAPNIIPEGIRT